MCALQPMEAWLNKWGLDDAMLRALRKNQAEVLFHQLAGQTAVEVPAQNLGHPFQQTPGHPSTGARSAEGFGGARRAGACFRQPAPPGGAGGTRPSSTAPGSSQQPQPPSTAEPLGGPVRRQRSRSPSPTRSERCVRRRRAWSPPWRVSESPSPPPVMAEGAAGERAGRSAAGRTLRSRSRSTGTHRVLELPGAQRSPSRGRGRSPPPSPLQPTELRGTHSHGGGGSGLLPSPETTDGLQVQEPGVGQRPETVSMRQFSSDSTVRSPRRSGPASLSQGRESLPQPRPLEVDAPRIGPGGSRPSSDATPEPVKLHTVRCSTTALEGKY